MRAAPVGWPRAAGVWAHVAGFHVDGRGAARLASCWPRRPKDPRAPRVTGRPWAITRGPGARELRRDEFLPGGSGHVFRPDVLGRDGRDELRVARGAHLGDVQSGDLHLRRDAVSHDLVEDE